MSSQKREEIRADSDWLQLFEERVSKHGAKKALAEALGVHPSMVSRMAKGGPVHPGHLYRASVILGIRPPTTLPLDAFQHRLMQALLMARDILDPEQVDKLVSHFEERVNRIVDAVAKIAKESDGASTRETLTAALKTIQDEVGGLEVGEAVFKGMPDLRILRRDDDKTSDD